jgi:hypothetical protein
MCPAIEEEESKTVPLEMGKGKLPEWMDLENVQLRQLVVREEVALRPRLLVGAKEVLVVAQEVLVVAQEVLVGRWDIAARCVLPCFFCLEEFDNIFGCARWPVRDDGAGGIQTDNVNLADFDCTER